MYSLSYWVVLTSETRSNPVLCSLQPRLYTPALRPEKKCGSCASSIGTGVWSSAYYLHCSSPGRSFIRSKDVCCGNFLFNKPIVFVLIILSTLNRRIAWLHVGGDDTAHGRLPGQPTGDNLKCNHCIHHNNIVIWKS